MVPNKSLDESKTIIAALLCDVHSKHGDVFNTRSLRLTLKKVESRLHAEGMGFLTKTLPRLCKAFDKALLGNIKMNQALHTERCYEGSELPRFLGEFFIRVFLPDGTIRQQPCLSSVKVVRDICYLFYKYKLPYTDEQEQQVISKFERTEDDLTTTDQTLKGIAKVIELEEARDEAERSRRFSDFDKYGLLYRADRQRSSIRDSSTVGVVREARNLLKRLFAGFDPKNIHPRHGPGAVATRQQPHEKYTWTNVSATITTMYPYDAYFCASFGHVCDTYDDFMSITDDSLPARVILVPKDSRGPRLISCEPVDYQWIQQGLGTAIVELVERHPLTRDNVRFTDQDPNRFGALMGSLTGSYSTLDLNEASDRVSLELVRLLFPVELLPYLEACRTSSTRLPDGRIIPLRKFAPMGSCLCFPILALTVWAILTAAAVDADTRESVYVYGDDVIVPTAFAANAIEQLESVGLRVNIDKSCTTGFFRESCGMDAFHGVNVTPVRLRTVWSSTPSPDIYTSWIAYANSFWDRGYYRTYDLIVGRLHSVYGAIPDDDMNLSCPSLRSVPEDWRPKRRRVNKSLQKLEFNVWDVQSPMRIKCLSGWSMLLRYFAEATTSTPWDTIENNQKPSLALEPEIAFSVRRYTNRRTSMLVRRWR
jgi:hypothetical protein